MGAVSVSNVGPSISYVDKDSTIRAVLEKSGITLQNEVDMLGLGREMGLVTVGLAFDKEDSLKIVQEARPDLFCFHAGTTKGGRVGFDSGENVRETAARTEEVYSAVRELAPGTLLIAHGAAMETVEDAEFMLNHTSGHGFWTGSSTERLPIEKAVSETARRFAKLRFKS
jgi:predicted TIM-barrel enzyme